MSRRYVAFISVPLKLADGLVIYWLLQQYKNANLILECMK